MTTYVRMLGPPAIEVDGDCLALSPGKTSALLYHLAYQGNWVSRDDLIYLFWPDLPEGQGRRNLRQLLSTSKRLPYASVDIEENRLRWLVPSDAREFKQAVAEQNWAKATQLYGGDLLQGYRAVGVGEFENWLELERQDLQASWREAALNLAAELEATERHRDAAALLLRVHKAEPFDEALLRHYLHTLHLGSQRDRALEAFEAFKQTLERELSSEPERETLRLIASIAQGKAPKAPVTVKAAQAPKAKHNLPLPPAPFIGREEAITHLSRLLTHADRRLITLVGPGGVGKTRLAIEVARAQAATYREGVYFVNLAPLTSADYIVSAIADALKFSFYGPAEPKNQLLAYLRDKEVLLLLDNFEHLVTAAPLVTELLEKAPKLKALVTSRTSLGLYGEQAYPVPPLTLPVLEREQTLDELGNYEAVQLFLERARAIKPGFAPTTVDAPVLAQLCHRLDGLPLAIELAAARIQLFSPKALLAELVGINGRSPLDLLTGGARDLPARQRTLRNTLDWSFSLLKADEQRLFIRLSVFIGSCSLKAIQAVCNAAGDLGTDVLECVHSLIAKSLLRQEGVGQEPRVVMLETVCEYAREKLEESGEAASMKLAHAEYFLALAEEAEPKLKGHEQDAWLERLEVEHDNLRAALRWALQQGMMEMAGRFTVALWWFWYVRGHLSEGRKWLEQALAGGDGVPASLHSRMIHGAGVLAESQGDFASARSHFEKSLAIERALGNKRGVANLLNSLGITVDKQGDHDLARACYEESLVIRRELGDKRGISQSLTNLGVVAKYQGDDASAKSFYEEALAIDRELGDKEGMAILLNNLGIMARNQGDYASAHAFCRESLAIRQELANKGGIASSLEAFAGLATAERKPERAARLWGAAAALRQHIGAPLPPRERAYYERDVSTARTQVGEAAFMARWAEGQAMTQEEVVSYALRAGN